MSNFPTPQSSLAGRWFLVCLGLSLALVGAVFVWLMARSCERAEEMRAWPEVKCEILVSEIEERSIDPNSAPEYTSKVIYGYEWKGKPYTSERFALRGNSWSSNRNIAEERLTQYPLGSIVTCRVNPGQPDFSVLKVDSLAPGYSIWFPCIFVLGGLVMVYRALKAR